ncbi:hypothetical protein [Gemmatimonas groenlandica]|uniref:Uncharacterized protein n=1 Tax=Gemmatimonas groenlandica TaxID=2732249 RepID=A0A6M4ILB8_9BACT|nr:hypothetical protein [Gemmatimonas groenlandica]QJR34327.1 hypothetical protein HKW67_01710 [Gemmatimonas groenlandica]
MTPPRIVVYATSRPFRVQCDALLRAAGAAARLASRQAELAKAVGEGTIAAVIAEDERHAEMARAVTRAVVIPRAPGESIEAIVARALGAAGT